MSDVRIFINRGEGWMIIMKKKNLPPIEYFFGNTPLMNWIRNCKPFKRKLRWNERRQSFNENALKWLELTDRVFVTAGRSPISMGIDPIDDYWNKFGKRDNEHFKKESDEFHSQILKTAQYYNAPIMTEDPEATKKFKQRMEQTRREMFDPDFIGPKRLIRLPDPEIYKKNLKNWLGTYTGEKSKLPLNQIIDNTNFNKGEFKLIGHVGLPKSQLSITHIMEELKYRGVIVIHREMSDDQISERILRYNDAFMVPIENILPSTYNIRAEDTSIDDLAKEIKPSILEPKDKTPWYIKASGGKKNRKNRRK